MTRKTSRRRESFKSFKVLSERLLKMAEEIFDACDSLDTAVRDGVAEGLAQIVYAAFDTQAVFMCLENESFDAFVSSGTCKWFECRGFADWFCSGAASCFHTSRPRTKAELSELITFRRSPGKKRRVA